MCIRAGRPRIYYIAGGCLAAQIWFESSWGDYRCRSSLWAMAARVLVDATRRRLAVTAGGQRTAALWRMARAAIGRLSWGVPDQALSSISTGPAATVGLAAGACVPAVAAANGALSQPRNYDIRGPTYPLGLPSTIAVMGQVRQRRRRPARSGGR